MLYWDHGLDHGRYWTELVAWFEGRRVISSEGLDQNVLLSFGLDLQRPKKTTGRCFILTSVSQRLVPSRAAESAYPDR